VGGRCHTGPLLPYRPSRSIRSPHHSPNSHSSDASSQTNDGKSGDKSQTTGGKNGDRDKQKGGEREEEEEVLVDLGASFIHGMIDNPITDLCEDQRFELVEPRGASKAPIFDYDGKLHAEDLASR
jgi:hypothetical protein